MRIVMEELVEEDNEEKEEEPANKTLRQKWEYFWDYHKWKLIVPVIILVFAVSIIVSYKQEAKELTLYIAMMNANMNNPEDADFGEQYAADRSIDTQALPIRIETNLYHPKSEMVDDISVASIQKYQALLTNGNVDVTITTSWVIDEYERTGCYLNLQEVLPSQLYESYSEKMYYASDERGNKIPVGIYVDQTEIMKEFYIDEKPIVTISAFSERVDASVDFITWLLAN